MPATVSRDWWLRTWDVGGPHTLQDGSFIVRKDGVAHHVTHHWTVVSKGEQLGRMLLHLTDGDAGEKRTLEGLHDSCNTTSSNKHEGFMTPVIRPVQTNMRPS